MYITIAPFTGFDVTFGNLLVAKYDTNTVRTIVSGVFTIYNYEDVVFDPYGLVTTGAAWKFTADHDGYYFCKAQVVWDLYTWAAGNANYLYCYKNNVGFAVLDWWQTNVNSAVPRDIQQEGSCLVWLDKGDFVDFRIWQTSGANKVTWGGAVYNSCVIYRV